MADFGNFCILFALCLSLFALLAALIGASQRLPLFVQSAERAVYAAAGCVTAALATLCYLLLTNDFSAAHVANSSSRSLPVLYKIAAIWGGHDGSMLLWVFFTAVLCAMVVYQNRSRNRDMMPYVVAVLMVNLSFFLALNFFLSNPFKLLFQIFPDGSAQLFVPADGQGLNPLLQYWAMVIHPPILYLGFIGFMVPFAFAMAALITRQQGGGWIRTTRRWTLWTWLLLGAGLLLGGKWAYVVLGWGGYWGWDPVENASLMPWLTATAFLHSVIVQQRRGMFKVWNMILIVITFLLGIFGTFLTRSGIVNSVHAFADSDIGRYFIYYMAAVLVISLVLIIDRRPCLKSDHRFDSMTGKESAFLFNNLVLVVSCFAVFWGTMFPVISEWIRGVKISVGPLFFNKINVPIGIILLFLTGAGPLFAWQKTSPAGLKKALARPVAAAAVAAAGLAVGGMRNVSVLICLSLCAFVLAAVAEEFYRGARARMRQKGENFASAAVRLTWKNKRRYGGYIVHVGIVMMFAGLAGNAFNQEASAFMMTGQEMKIGRYTLKMAGLREGQTDQYQYGRVFLEAYKDGKRLDVLKPEKRIFNEGRQATTTVGLYSTPGEDLYVVFTGMTEDSKCEIKAYVNPLVFWVWAGSAVLLLGGIVAVGSGQSAVGRKSGD